MGLLLRPAAILGAAIAVSLAAQPVAAQQAAVRIHGTVRHQKSKELLSGAEVRVVGTDRTLHTGADGAFEFADLAPGKFVIEARLIGFQPVRASFELAGGQNREIGFVMAPFATPLPEVKVAANPAMTGQMAEFYRRRAEGHGHYITRADLERLHPMLLSDVLDQVPGVRIECHDRRCWVDMGRVQPSLIGDPKCHVQYFVDGVRYGTSAEEVDINSFKPDDIEGIEVYRGMAGVPARYTGRDVRCGVVLIWIRIGRRN